MDFCIPNTCYDHARLMEIVVNGPGKANRLFIATGMALIDFQGDSDEWSAGNYFLVVPQIGNGYLNALVVPRPADLSAIAFPATIDLKYGAGQGWGINWVDARYNDEDGTICLDLRMVVKGYSSRLLRIGYQVNILTQV